VECEADMRQSAPGQGWSPADRESRPDLATIAALPDLSTPALGRAVRKQMAREMPRSSRLGRDCGAKAPIRLVVTICIIATAVAVGSPDFQANPVLGHSVNEIRKHLPETFDRITRAMAGNASAD